MEYYATIKTNEDDLLMPPHLVMWKYHQDIFHGNKAKSTKYTKCFLSVFFKGEWECACVCICLHMHKNVLKNSQQTNNISSCREEK